MQVIKLPRDHNHTTRCYPRSMREAFQNDANHAEYIEAPAETISNHDLIVVGVSLMLWVCLGYLFAK